MDKDESGWPSAEVFSSACAALPLVSIDLFITRTGEHGPELLLGRRRNRPAQGWWFTPGGRIRKNEPLAEAMARVAREEVGLGAAVLAGAELLGAWDHFYPDSAFDAAVSSHYVNLAYLVELSTADAEALALPREEASQHSDWHWWSLGQAAEDSAVHENVRVVVAKLLERT
ncbi:NUDIX domain-containing protein [Thioalkalivibrio sp. XN279]|uniref:NUDIX domain-containing protein n=1 Tax=Thioalkalivibrio sp. XN279 TaxID=2714953 RepID=UPI0019807A87